MSEDPIGFAGLPVDSLIALRFSTPLRVDTANAATIALTGPNGAEAVRIVAAEHGMLVFLTPAGPLMPGAAYTISVNGAEGPQGALMPFTQVRFTTGPAGTGASGQAAGQAAHQHRPAGPPASPGTPSELDAFEWTGEMRDGRPHSRWQELAPLQAPAGVTALAGQVLRLNGEPLADVTLEIGARSARTDQTGRFLLTGIDAGGQELEMDGSTANRPGRTYATFSYGVTITAATTTVLPFTIWMPLLDMQHATSIPVPTQGEVVARTPLIPGLEVHIPANVVLRTYDGPLTALSLTRIPVDRPPFPLPPGTTFFFTPQGHGAHVERPDGTESPRGVRMILPNPDHLPPGTRVELTSYDYVHGGWYTYGQGTVSEDGRQIVPDPGVEFKRVTCAFTLGMLINAIGAVLGGATAGEPVDLATGLFTMEKTDLVLPDLIPIVIRREYWQTYGGPPGIFGPGQNFLYQMFLTGDQTTYTVVELPLPGGSKVRFPRINGGTDKASGVFEHTATPTAWYKARVTWNTPRNGWDLTRKDGMVYQFSSGGVPGPMLTGIRDRLGNQLTVARTANQHGQDFTRITSPNGRCWVDVTWENLGTYHITQLRDNLGRTRLLGSGLALRH